MNHIVFNHLESSRIHDPFIDNACTGAQRSMVSGVSSRLLIRDDKLPCGGT
jgi:hypothetical protein